MVYWRGKHWDGRNGSSGINQGHADTVQGIGRTVPVQAVMEMEERIERIEGEVLEECNTHRRLLSHNISQRIFRNPGLLWVAVESLVPEQKRNFQCSIFRHRCCCYSFVFDIVILTCRTNYKIRDGLVE